MRYSYLLTLFLLATLTVNSQNVTDSLATEHIGNQNIETKSDSMPEYPGGLTKMHYFIRDNLRYPMKAQQQEIEGRVAIKIMISKTGEIFKYNINRSVHPLLDQEALRVVKRMPKKGWTPRKVNGESVDMHYIIPIIFRLRSR